VFRFEVLQADTKSRPVFKIIIMRISLYTIVILFFFTNLLIAQEQSCNPLSEKQKAELDSIMQCEVKGSFGIDFEQDFLLDMFQGVNRDRNYTQGTAFSYTKPGIDKTLLFFPLNALDWLNKISGRDKYQINLPSTFAFGVTAFTPRVIDSVAPVVGDRPFGNFVFMSTIKHKYNIRTRAITKTSFNYALLGTNVTNTFQSFMHRDVVPGRPVDISWHHQISRGGHFAFLFSHEYTRPVVNLTYGNDDDKRSWFTSSLGYQVDLGWYTGIGTKLGFKIGSMSHHSTDYSGLDNTLANVHKMMMVYENTRDSLKKRVYSKKMNAVQKEIQDKEDLVNAKQKAQNEFPENISWDWYFFGSIKPRLTPHNSLILGQPHVESVYTLDNEDYNPFLIDVEYGFVLSRIVFKEYIPVPVSRVDILLSVNHRSPEIRNDNYRRWHHWGRISLRFPLF